MLRPAANNLTQVISRLYFASVCSASLYSLCVMLYIWIWLPAARLRSWGIAVMRMEDIALFTALLLVVIGITLLMGCFVLKRSPPKSLSSGVLLALVLSLLNFVLLPPVVG